MQVNLKPKATRNDTTVMAVLIPGLPKDFDVRFTSVSRNAASWEGISPDNPMREGGEHTYAHGNPFAIKEVSENISGNLGDKFEANEKKIHDLILEAFLACDGLFGSATKQFHDYNADAILMFRSDDEEAITPLDYSALPKAPSKPNGLDKTLTGLLALI